VQLSSLRTNKSLCGPVGLRPLPADYQPVEEMLPGVTMENEEQEVTSEEAEDVYQSAEQLGAELVTLSLLPESRWKSLLHLDNIKVSGQLTGATCELDAVHRVTYVLLVFSCLQRRNKPVAPPTAPPTAPFFLPTVPGLAPQFMLPTATQKDTQVEPIRTQDPTPCSVLCLFKLCI